MMGNQKIESDVEYMNYGSPTGGYGYNRSGAVWGGAAGGLVVGALGGYLLGKNQKGYGHDGHGGHNCGFNNFNGCCSENTPVNRFELKQAEELACKDSIIATLKAEKYADAVADKALREAIAYTDKMTAPLFAAVTKLNDKTCDLKERVAIDEERIFCLGKEICEVEKDTNKAFKETWHRIREEYIHQPRIKVCCDGTPTFECAREVPGCGDFTPLV